MNWEAVFNRIYKSKALRAESWIEKASDLIVASSFLESEIDQVWENLKKAAREQNTPLGNTRIIAIYLMLLAYAIENMLKARIIKMNLRKHQQTIETTRKLPPELRSHDLYKLAALAEIQIDDAEEDLLRRLTRSAIWAGRYPVPLSSADLEGQKYSDGDIKNDSAYLISDRASIKKLIDKLNLACRSE